MRGRLEMLEAFDSAETLIDLNHLVSRGNDSAMIIEIEGYFNCPEVDDGDHVILDLGREPKPGELIIAKIDDGYTIKRFEVGQYRNHRSLYLVPVGHHVPKRVRQPDIVGVVTYVLKRMSGK